MTLTSLRALSRFLVTVLIAFSPSLLANPVLQYQFENQQGGVASLYPIADFNPGINENLPRSSKPVKNSLTLDSDGSVSDSRIWMVLGELPNSENHGAALSQLYTEGTPETTHTIEYEVPRGYVYSAQTIYIDDDAYRLHFKRTGYDSYDDYHYSTLIQVLKHDKTSQKWQQILDFRDTPEKHHSLDFVDDSGLLVYWQSDFRFNAPRDYIIFDAENLRESKRFSANIGFTPTSVHSVERLDGTANYQLLSTKAVRVNEQKMMASIYDSTSDSIEYIPDPMISAVGDAHLFTHKGKYYALDRPGREAYEFYLYRLDPNDNWRATKLTEFDGDFTYRRHQQYHVGGGIVEADGLYITSLALERYGEVSTPYSYPITGYQYFDFATETLSEHPITALLREDGHEGRSRANAYWNLDLAYTSLFDPNTRTHTDYLMSPGTYFARDPDARYGELTQVGAEYSLQSYIEGETSVQYNRYFLDQQLNLVELQSGTASLDVINPVSSPYLRTHGFDTIAQGDYTFSSGALYTFREDDELSLFWKDNGAAPVKIIDDLGKLLINSGMANVSELENPEVGPIRFIGTLDNRLLLTGYNNQIGEELFALDLHCESGLTFSSPQFRDNSFYLQKNTQYRIPLTINSIVPLTPDDIVLPPLTDGYWEIRQEMDYSMYIELFLENDFESQVQLQIQIDNGCASSDMEISIRTDKAQFQYKTENDFDGDGMTDLAFRRPFNALNYIKESSTGVVTSVKFGLSPRDIAVPGDYDGDGITDIAVRRPNTGFWYIQNSSDSNYNSIRADGIQRMVLGSIESDVPVPADYDGDGITDIAVWRPNNGIWYIRLSSENPDAYSQNITSVKIDASADDVPVPADYNGDWIAEPAIYNKQDGHWYIMNINDNSPMQTRVIHLGYVFEDAIPVPADYDGDGKVDLAIRVPSQQQFYGITQHRQTILSSMGSKADDIPIIGDYDSDGKADFAIKRPSTSTVLLENSQDGSITQLKFGTRSQDIMLSAPVNYRMQLQQF